MSRGGDNENPLDFSWTSEWQNEHAESQTPPDRGPDPARRPARHAKRDGTLYGDYHNTPTGPANGGKHGKSWNGRD